MLPLDPFQRRAALDEAYRLKPDHRILLAVEAVQRFFLAGAPGTATAVREGEGWRIRLGPTEVGRLSDLPDFQQALLLLDAFAKRLARDASSTPASSFASSVANPCPRRRLLRLR